MSVLRIGLALAPVAALCVAAPPPRKQVVPPRDALTLAFSGEQNGYLSPCGCSAPMLGGMPRRAGFLAGLPRETALLKVDVGDLTEAAGRQDEMKAETLIDMFNSLGYTALCPGEKDFGLGMAFLESLKSRFRGDLVCANVRRSDGSAPFRALTERTVTIAGAPVRVVVVGLLSGRFAETLSACAPDVTLQPPHESLEALRKGIAAGGIRVLLFHGEREEARSLARAFPLFDLIICAHEGDHPAEPERIGRTALTTGGQDGKYAGLASLWPGHSRPVAVQSRPLGPEFPEDARMRAIEDAYLARVADEDLLGQTPRRPLAAGVAYAGSAACARCHQSAQAAWSASGHSHALATLRSVRHDRDPDCVRCHVVGLEREGGFLSPARTPHLAAVGCESCHGAAAQHVADPKRTLGPVKEAGCTGCHNPQNSPRFNFATYWPKVRHGK